MDVFASAGVPEARFLGQSGRFQVTHGPTVASRHRWMMDLRCCRRGKANVMGTGPEQGATEKSDLRSRAVARLKRQADFRVNLMVYLIVNACLVGIWAVNGRPFFWPVFSIVGWGIGVLFDAYDAYDAYDALGHSPSEARIEREMKRIQEPG